MFVATIVISALLALVLFVSAVGKVRRDPNQMKSMRTVRFPEDKLVFLATAEAAGAVGLLAGLAYWPLGAAAAVGVVLYFVGAVAAHLRVGDRSFGPAAGLLVAGAAALALRLLSA